ncbi:MAG TPA: hypothetical protein VHB99_02000 [Pirellulales bacterium]|nr:hypothetical protein [Pirellulales bacterium]
MRVRFRYSLRGLGVLTAIIAAGLGWYVGRIRPQEQAVTAILEAGGCVLYDGSESDAHSKLLRPDNNLWRRTFGFATYVSLHGRRPTEGHAICAQLAKLSALRVAHLNSIGIQDADLTNLRLLMCLEMLGLDGNPLTDAGVKHLLNLPRLRTLDLSRTNVSDSAIVEIAKIKSLEFLDVSETSVTEQGVEELHRLMPECRVFWRSR